MHGGSVGIESAGENMGATVKLVLPLVVEQETHEFSEQNFTGSVVESDTKSLLNGVRVLLVEDNEDSREMLKTMFDQHGMKTIAVDSAAAALSEIKKIQPDILISDVGLPGEDGYELIGKIRQLPFDQGGAIPAVALTGYASSQDRARAFAVGYQEHLSKPVDIDKLLELVKQLVVPSESSQKND
jgi:CheY-like chemotaxis protein